MATSAPASFFYAPAAQCAAAGQSKRPTPSPLEEPLVAESLRDQLRKQASNLAALGSWDELDEYVHMMFLIGDTPEDHQPLRPGWLKRIQNADPNKVARKSKLVAKSLKKPVAALVKCEAMELAERCGARGWRNGRGLAVGDCD